MTNEELLRYPGVPDSLLTTIEQQERFILRQASIPKPCPNCNALVNQFAAAGLQVNEFSTGSTHEEYKYQCPKCKRALLFTLPLVGGWIWRLVPESINAG